MKYVGNSEERLLNAARQALGHVEETETEIRRKNERKQIWKDKVLHGQFMRQTEEEDGKERRLWLTGAGIKRETELLIMAAQEQAIRTNVIKLIEHRKKASAECAVEQMRQ